MFRFIDNMFSIGTEEKPKKGQILDLLAIALTQKKLREYEDFRKQIRGFGSAAMEVITYDIDMEAANDNNSHQEPGNPTAGFSKIVAQISSLSPKQREDLKQGIIPKDLEQ